MIYVYVCAKDNAKKTDVYFVKLYAGVINFNVATRQSKPKKGADKNCNPSSNVLVISLIYDTYPIINLQCNQ